MREVPGRSVSLKHIRFVRKEGSTGGAGLLDNHSRRKGLPLQTGLDERNNARFSRSREEANEADQSSSTRKPKPDLLTSYWNG